MSARTILGWRTFYLCIVLAVWAISPAEVSAQSFLGKARQACDGVLNVTPPQQETIAVNPFQSLTVDTLTASIELKCETDVKSTNIQCPPDTNRIVIDRTQGPNIYSIICLRN